MIDFKYKTIPMFFDADNIACTFVNEVSKLYPHLSGEFMSKAWDISKKDNSITYYVLAIADAQDIIIDDLEE